jgi:hypothetical protein
MFVSSPRQTQTETCDCGETVVVLPRGDKQSLFPLSNSFGQG